MIYIASLYSNGLDKLDCPYQKKALLQKRVDYTRKRVYEFLMQGHRVYSPISHCYELSLDYDLPQEYDWWQEHDRYFIDSSTEVWVLAMDDKYGDWTISKGIGDEVEYAKRLGIPVKFIDCEDYE